MRAKEKYEQLYAVYHQINSSQLEKIHKEVAYQQLLTSYHLIEELKQQSNAPINIIAIAIVIILVSVIVFINPRMIGLAVFQELKNSAPVWTGEPKTITVKGITAIDFGQYFSDTDGDELVYLAMAPEGLKTTVSGSIISIEPENSLKGEKMLDIIVSDMKHSTRAKILVIVE